MVYIENEGALFRGVSRGLPKEVWNPSQGKFVPYTWIVPKRIEWGCLIDHAEAERIMAESKNGPLDDGLPGG